MKLTVKLPELDLNDIHVLKVLDAQVVKSKSGNDMIKLLLKEKEKSATVVAFVLLNRFDDMRSFARAFSLPIENNVLEFDTDELIDAEVKASVRQFDDGSYVVKKFYPMDYTAPARIRIADLDATNSSEETEEGSEDPFAE